MPFFKNVEQEGKNRSYLRVGTSGRWEDIRKRCRRMNIVEILCTYVWKWKNETC
jgi:hypothetical protein